MEERLQKYMARCGVASRRKCEEIILEGKIKVNGAIITEVGTKIDPEKDIVEYNDNVIKIEEKKVYIMLNKPEGYITSVNLSMVGHFVNLHRHCQHSHLEQQASRRK